MERGGALDLDPRARLRVMAEYAGPDSTRSTWRTTTAAPRSSAAVFLALAAGEPPACRRPTPSRNGVRAGPDDGGGGARRGRAQPDAPAASAHRSAAVPLVDFEHPAYLDAMRSLAELRDEGLIRHIGLTNFDTEHLRMLVEARHSDRLEPGLRFRCSTGAPARRNERVCLEQACTCWPTARSAADCCPSAGSAARTASADIADWSKMKYKRFIEAIGGWSVAPGDPRAASRGGTQAWRLDRQCGHALGPRSAGGRRGDRRREVRREGASADNSRVFVLRLDEDDSAVIDAGALEPPPRRLRRRVPPARRS